ncbi:uncharacterized protein IL334_002730 [Kwoniella shivajii]|uniref:Uncharacterized protein n=1 Tax=Kwoniella shivajii TaxID=564305 RepID=A0ABZ1CYL6_9TREE|nr:hypothetical protein IL334_002730 [Kwoniella shivajii]
MNSSNMSVRTAALLALSQDITALISLTLEAVLSFVNIFYRSILQILGYERRIYIDRDRRIRSESGRGCGVVVLGANEAAGQSLTLHLAKIGYTVFPLIPLPSPSSPPTSSALTHLLLTWSGVQKRLRARYPGHPGGVVPVIIDPEGISNDLSTFATRGDLKKPERRGGGVGQAGGENTESRFGHAGETVKAYCKENNLSLVAIVCTSRKPKLISTTPSNTKTVNSDQVGGDNSLDMKGIGFDKSVETSTSSSISMLSEGGSSKETIDQLMINENSMTKSSTPPTLPPSALTLTDESTLISLWRSNILDPLAIVKELTDLLAIPASLGHPKARIVFVGGENGRIVDINDESNQILFSGGADARAEGAMKVIQCARKEMINIMRNEMSIVGVDVCEVLVGPMSSRLGTTGYHLRHSIEDSNEGASAILGDTLKRSSAFPGLSSPGGPRRSKEAILSSRLQLLSRLWAVDDALLFSSVRRAIEDPYARYIHRAGISPLINELLLHLPFGIGTTFTNMGGKVVKKVLEVDWVLRERVRNGGWEGKGYKAKEVQ